MLQRITQLARIGRLRWSQASPALRRVTTIYGRNAAGKSTLVRVLAAAARQSVAGVLDLQTLGTTEAPVVELQFSAGTARFDGAWTGEVPKLVVFDRAFVDANVHVGQRLSKEHRKEWLRLALGSRDVELARALDELSKRGKQLASERSVHLHRVEAAARANGITVDVFARLVPPADEAAKRAEITRRLEDARFAKEIQSRPRLRDLPPMPLVDVDAMRDVLRRDTKAVSAEVAARVQAHFEQVGSERWVRDGMRHCTGSGCPFCGQDLAGSELVALYRQWFDTSYETVVASITAALAALDRLGEWWRELRRVGAANADAFGRWSDLPFERPDFQSPERKKLVDEAVALVRAHLLAKQQRPTAAILADVEPAALQLATVANAIRSYNDALAPISALIDERVRRVAALSVTAIERELVLLDAAIVRGEPDIVAAVAEIQRIDRELDTVKHDKASATERFRHGTQTALDDFATRANRLLGELGASFRLRDLGAERAGGSSGARFTLVVEDGALEVATSAHEERFSRILSEGDRSTLAFAIFLLSLDDMQDLDARIVVLDDPMTSQDALRSDATAAHIAKLAVRAQQVIVLSHDGPFLGQVARHVGAANLLELELDRDARSLAPATGG